MTTTVTTTVTSSSALQIAGTFGLLIILGLIGFLIAKEIVVGAPWSRRSNWNQALLVGIVPLTISFVVIVAVNLALVMS